MKKPTGELIYDIIIRENVSQSALCRGLCSTSAFSRYLNGERTLDRLLFTVILQRLGKSPDKFITMLTDEEYGYFEWKQCICQAQLSRNWKQMQELLQEEQAKNRSCNALLQEQHYILLQGIVEEKIYGNRKESVRLIGKAIALTVPGFPGQAESLQLSAWKTFEEQCMGRQLFGEQEILAILLWQSLQQEQEISSGVLPFLMNYIETHCRDEQEMVKLYPKVAAKYLQVLYQEGKYHECMSITEKALDMMVSTGYSFCLETILTMQIYAAEKLGLSKQFAKRKVQLEAWKEVLQEYRTEPDDAEDLFMLDIWQEAELLHETLSLRRQESGYSQEALSEGICTPETLSRIETGKRPPRRKTYRALNEKLSLRRDYFYSVIETDDFRVLEKKWQLEKLLMQRKWEEAEAVLEALRKCLDLSVGCNLQYLELNKYAIQCGLNQQKKSIVPLKRILGYTMKMIPQSMNVEEWPDNFWVHTFTNSEMTILIQMSDVLAVAKHTNQAIYLLERMLDYYIKSRVEIEFHYRIVNLIIGRLSGYYGILKNGEKEFFFSEEGIKIMMHCGTKRNLPAFLNNKADALELLGKIDASLKYYKLAYYCSELMQTNIVEIAKRSYEKLAGKLID